MSVFKGSMEVEGYDVLVCKYCLCSQVCFSCSELFLVIKYKGISTGVRVQFTPKSTHNCTKCKIFVTDCQSDALLDNVRCNIRVGYSPGHLYHRCMVREFSSHHKQRSKDSYVPNYYWWLKWGVSSTGRKQMKWEWVIPGKSGPFCFVCAFCAPNRSMFMFRNCSYVYNLRILISMCACVNEQCCFRFSLYKNRSGLIT